MTNEKPEIVETPETAEMPEQRRAWASNLAFVRAYLRTKAALDRVEDEAGTRVPSRPRGFWTEDD